MKHDLTIFAALIGMPQAIVWSFFFPPKETPVAEAGMIYMLRLGLKFFFIDVFLIAASVVFYFTK